MNPIRQFQDHIEEAGLLPGVVEADGALHRCPVDGGKPGARDGVYKFHPDPPCSGYFKNHKTGQEGTWTSSNGGEKMSSEDRERLRQKIEKEKAEGERKKQEAWAATAKKAQALYAKAQECTDHAYLSSKGVDVVPGLKVMGNVLLVPRMGLNKEIISLVRIWPDGDKKNLPGSYPPGGFFSIKGKDGPLLICEGVSTGISLHMATGLTVVCSFDCGNLLPVAQGARSMYPDREIRICSDHDGATPGNPGLKHSKQAAQKIKAKLAVPSLPGKDKADFNDVHLELGLDQVKAQVGAAQEVDPQDQEECSPDGEQTQAQGKDWIKALEIFPRVPMPWRILPPAIVQSFKQLARSCATSPLSLPGVGLAIICGAVGNLINVYAKSSWSEPLTFYIGDLRDSGDGKTSPLWALAAPLCKRQEEELKRAEEALQEYEALPKNEQKQSKRPSPARGYFATGLTLEGLRQDTANSPTGGVVIIMSELSSFVTSQNQYKGGGDDRESWLCLHDGKPARVVRAGGRTAYIKGARPQVVGGIQPTVYKKAFTSQDGVFLTDGSLFRFLITHEPSTHFDLTAESWTDENRQAWEYIVNTALKWADSRTSQNQFDFNLPGPQRLQLTEEAQEFFFDWRNDISSRKHELPPLVRGYIPKLVGYALRLTGALHLLKQFADGVPPRQAISLEEIKDGVALAMFYGGQAVSALRLIQEEDQPGITETSERTLTLARTLTDLRDQVDSGRLAIGLIQEEYNRRAPATEQFRTARSMGAFLRSLSLTMSNGKHTANGRHGVYCLVWDQKVENFLEDIEDIEKQSPQTRGSVNTDFEDIEDIEDMFSDNEVVI